MAEVYTFTEKAAAEALKDRFCFIVEIHDEDIWMEMARTAIRGANEADRAYWDAEYKKHTGRDLAAERSQRRARVARSTFRSIDGGSQTFAEALDEEKEVGSGSIWERPF